MEKDEKLIPPKRPSPDECCLGGSCNDCVWKEYETKLKVYLEKKDARDKVENDNGELGK